MLHRLNSLSSSNNACFEQLRPVMRARCVIYKDETSSFFKQLGFHGNQLTGPFVCFYHSPQTTFRRWFKRRSLKRSGSCLLVKPRPCSRRRLRWVEHAWCKPETSGVAAQRCSTAAAQRRRYLARPER